jgi:hypothetical protein
LDTILVLIRESVTIAGPTDDNTNMAERNNDNTDTMSPEKLKSAWLSSAISARISIYG